MSKPPNRSRAAGLLSVNSSNWVFTLKNGSQQVCGVYNPFFLNHILTSKINFNAIPAKNDIPATDKQISAISKLLFINETPLTTEIK